MAESAPMMRAVDPTDMTWTCGSCGSERLAEDRFCGVCASPRDTGAGDAAASAAPRRQPASTYRSLILGAAVLAPLVVAIVLSRHPAAEGVILITVEPATWRCDGADRAWSADLSAANPDIVVQLRTGDADGTVATETRTTLDGLAAERTESGGYRVVTSATTAPECSLAPGPYALVVLDGMDGAVLASGLVDLQP